VPPPDVPADDGAGAATGAPAGATGAATGAGAGAGALLTAAITNATAAFAPPRQRFAAALHTMLQDLDGETGRRKLLDAPNADAASAPAAAWAWSREAGATHEGGSMAETATEAPPPPRFERARTVKDALEVRVGVVGVQYACVCLCICVCERGVLL